MVRIGLGILAAGGALALSACSSSGNGPIIPPSTGGATSGSGGAGNTGNTTSTGATANGGGGGGTGASMCTTDCCPTDASCYSTSAGNGSPGSECLATRDNSGQKHVQLRQTWITAKTPAGNAAPSAVYGILASRSELPWATCKQGSVAGVSAGGYIELDDFFMQDTVNRTYTDGDYSWVGFAAISSASTAAGAPTLCYGQQTYTGNAKYALTLAQMGGMPTGWPAGAAAPMPLSGGTWTVGPSKAKRVMTDFDPKGNRTAVLAMFDKTSPTYVGDGYSGLFYYDPTTGTGHGFGALGWVTVYDGTGKNPIQVPIREVEKKSTVNDKNHPDCIGDYIANVNTNTAACSSPLADDTMAAWGGGNCTALTGTAACAAGTSSYQTTGFFYVPEIEQVYSADLGQTLCFSYPGTSDPNFTSADKTSCIGPKWNPSDPVNGLPNGDWCAATNSAATTSCHDSYHSISYHTFSGAAIKLDTPDGTPSICQF